jgi:glycosyltransferase involved in cell wall biosynthesis
MGTFYAGFDIVRTICLLLFDRRVDIVVSVGESNILFALLLRSLLAFKPPLVLREISALGWRPRDKVVDVVLRRVDRILLLTQQQRLWAEARFALKAPPDVVGFAIDEAFYQPQDRPETPSIAAVGDDVGRDYACLIAACQHMPYKLVLRTGARLAIPDEMRDRVTTLGRLPHLALRDLYATASVIALPLLPVDYPSGITSLFEAMAMGRAVVATRTGTTSEFLQDGWNGLLVAPGDVQAMRAALTRAMEDAALRACLGLNARKTIEDRCSHEHYAQRLADSLRSVVASASGPRLRHHPS